MTQTYDQTWAVEQLIKSALQANGTFWANIDGHLFEGAAPRNFPIHQAGHFCLVRQVTLPPFGLDDNLVTYAPPTQGPHMTDFNVPSDSTNLAWATYDYEVVVAAETESYGDLSADAHRIFTTLNSLESTRDNNTVRFFVIAPIKRRRYRDSRLYKELGHKFRVQVRDKDTPLSLSADVQLGFGNIGAEVNLRPYIYSVHFHIGWTDIGGTSELHAIWTVEGFVLNDGHMYDFLQLATVAGANGVYYGPNGHASGAPKITATDVSMFDFQYLHGSADTPGMGPASSMRWRASFGCLFGRLSFGYY
jgi:hypothetical protein